jgi:hypothetical protein
VAVAAEAAGSVAEEEQAGDEGEEGEEEEGGVEGVGDGHWKFISGSGWFIARGV